MLQEPFIFFYFMLDVWMALGLVAAALYWVFIEKHITNVRATELRAVNIAVVKKVKCLWKNTSWLSRKHTKKTIKIYLNEERLRIIKELRLKLKLQTGSWKLWSLEWSSYGLLLTGGSRECRQWTGENNILENFPSMSAIIASVSKHSLTK